MSTRTRSGPGREPKNLLPRRWNGPISLLGQIVLALFRWQIVGRLPNLEKAVIIGAPHDRTADFILGIAAIFKLRLRVTFLGKASLFRGLLGVLMRWLGGIPVDRKASHDVVTTIADKIRESDKLLLALSPEGTRSKVPRWRTGFYHIAVKAGVPILPVALDYPNRCLRIGDPILPTGEIDEDIERLEDFYGELTGPILVS